MAESKSHKHWKNKAAGKNGQTEVKLCTGQKLDALDNDTDTATEVEKNGEFLLALQRLVDSNAPNKVFFHSNKNFMHTLQNPQAKAFVSCSLRFEDSRFISLIERILFFFKI